MHAAQAGSFDEPPESRVERSPGVARDPRSPSRRLRVARIAPRACGGLGRESRDRPRLRARPLDRAKRDVRHRQRVPARSAPSPVGRVGRARSEGNARRGDRERIPRRRRGFCRRAFPDPIARVAQAKHSALESLCQCGDRDRMRRLPRGPGVARASRRRRLGGRAAPRLLAPSGDAVRDAVRREPVPARRGPRQRAHGGAHAGRRASVAKRQRPSSAAVTLVPGLAARADVIVRRGATPRNPRDGWRDAVDDEAVLSVPAREHIPRRENVIVWGIIIAQAGGVTVEEIRWRRRTGRHRSVVGQSGKTLRRCRSSPARENARCLTMHSPSPRSQPDWSPFATSTRSWRCSRKQVAGATRSRPADPPDVRAWVWLDVM